MKINKSSSFKYTGKTLEKSSLDKKDDIKDKFESSSGEQIPVNTHKKWLFMNYVAADCNLKSALMDSVDNQELVGSDENTHIVALIDAGPGPNPMDGKWSGARTFYVTHDDELQTIKSPVISEHGEHLDMSSPKVLKDFIVDTMKKFPADNVAIVLSDHGGGFTGAMEDSTDGDFMSSPNLRQALEDAQKETGKKLDILGFNACLMADTEAAYEFKNNADILLASEESEYSPGWTFQPMLGYNMGKSIQNLQRALTSKIDVSPKEFAEIVVEVNSHDQAAVPTFSATDLTKMDNLADATDNLAKAIIKTEDKESVKKSIMKAEHYGGPWQPYADMRDLHHIAEILEKDVPDPEIKKAAKDLQKTFKETVFANQSDPEKYPNAKGLHIYAPSQGSESIAYKGGYKYDELHFAKDTHWDEAMKIVGDETATNNPRPLDPHVWPDGSPRKKKD